MKTAQIIFIAAFALPAIASAQSTATVSDVQPAPAYAAAPSTTPVSDVQREQKENDAAKLDIQANAAEIAADEGKLKDSRAGEVKAIAANRVEESADLAAAAKDKTLSLKAKKTKKAAIRKDMKAERKITREQADADRKPLEKDVRLDKAAVVDGQKDLDEKEAAEKK